MHSFSAWECLFGKPCFLNLSLPTTCGELLYEIQYRGDSVVITRSGKAVAALIDIDRLKR